MTSLYFFSPQKAKKKKSAEISGNTGKSAIILSSSFRVTGYSQSKFVLMVEFG